ncbi:sulfite exporter TauE/SafE family protein [Draconibacterium halophilum]|uniref:Probable membrane transporter protein n=1 Tax=Draconibacterium halophilum TaxID=2706887 RepID=A0A6C0RKJ9_9BACT|nr:sulfite exporter TauE/SafE family protein [Draconibacterium halophilum]QIA09811.1 sulfite exporter TauE/SafE family protein [Draconibacterium halophilum]
MLTLDFTILQWILLASCGMLIGMSKVGVPGVSMLVVPTLALIFGGKASTGILLPMLMMADLFGVGYYHRHAEWKYLWKLLPWAFVGIGIALWVGEVVNDTWFKNIIAILVFLCIGLMLWRDRKKGQNLFPDTWWFSALMGVLGGFATMIGNVAGPIFAIYLLAMHLPKNKFIGTGAWFFLIVNFSKFPLHIFVWKTINWDTLTLDLMLLPAIAIGAFAGIKLVQKISDKLYRTALIIVTALSAFLLLI